MPARCGRIGSFPVEVPHSRRDVGPEATIRRGDARVLRLRCGVALFERAVVLRFVLKTTRILGPSLEGRSARRCNPSPKSVEAIRFIRAHSVCRPGHAGPKPGVSSPVPALLIDAPSGRKRQPSEEWLARSAPPGELVHARPGSCSPASFLPRPAPAPFADQVVPSSTVPPCKFQIAVANQVDEVDEAAQAFIAVMLILVMRCD